MNIKSDATVGGFMDVMRRSQVTDRILLPDGHIPVHAGIPAELKGDHNFGLAPSESVGGLFDFRENVDFPFGRFIIACDSRRGNTKNDVLNSE